MPRTTQDNSSLSGTFDNKEAQCILDINPNRLLPKSVNTTNPVPFTQSMQDNNFVLVSTHSHVVLQTQVVAINTPMDLICTCQMQ